MKRKEIKFRERNELILATAEKLIKKIGYADFKMSDLSDEVDIAKGTLYLHYKSKEILVYNLIAPKMSSLLEQLKDLNIKKMSFDDKFRTLIQVLFDSSFFNFVVLSFPNMGELFKEDKGEEISFIQSAIIDCITQIIDEGKRSLIKNHIPSRFLALQVMQVQDPIIYNELVLKGDMAHQDFIDYTCYQLLFGMKGEI
ncbi:hypothetical protein AJ85_12275 [Alkalihalobacillus alcalophilus ATCC 27647 = CGMCC 1.3604]|uniref:HTH tetR-type domain-containing protein n=1 Tax=Alkalihalobacillus alcalophilus ATCC 27647 = CGMCC 1.3604 TaxID=1218173 RepID=A0A4S4JZE4_ALKAL|nr:TetR/AcrR family transcriptional regulator [Alkalihalobacillus alcalophilus]MED1563843.1 TetR/AcrR family transcriptional regulator [Alkalihalobacillus alcalophilus]THG90170.1 hypothetical protein AJ85_12275 [Alkalihalobacillus alcalophilus ATCC 27647 = CGMCC 1.3604]